MRNFVIILGLLSLSACQTVNAPAPVTSGRQTAAPIGAGRFIDVAVQASGGWQASGVLLLDGENYRLTASGQWSMGPFCGMIGADAVGNNPLCSADRDGLGARGGTLIGRVGANGPPFPIGTGRTLKPGAEGELFMRSYDWLPGDNTGTIMVRISPDSNGAETGAIPRHRDPL